ncbi:MAG TPA: heavy metal translocating P-type ATPase [Firmicutes bacterium]|nr:heavy metal translocating P-type ATPase [Bacillota bacterium]
MPAGRNHEHNTSNNYPAGTGHHDHGMKDSTAQSALAGPGPEEEHSGRSDHDHGGHGAHSPEMFKQRFWLSLILTIPVLAYSYQIREWFGFDPPLFSGSQYIPFIFGTVIYFYGGLVFLQGARNELKNRRPGMMTLISLAITVAYVYSVLVTFGVPGEDIYWELATLVAIMLLGHWLEMEAVTGARGALQELARLIPDRATLLDGNDEKEVAVSALKPGDIVLVRPGSRLPADGQIIKGESYVNEAVLTGESKPVPRGEDDKVIAGSLNEDGSLRVRVEKKTGETVLAGIMRLVEEAQSSRTRTQILADRAAFWLTVVALGSALATAAAWFLLGKDTVFVMERVVTVLVIACPHALGLAIPLVIAISTSMAARSGLLVRDRLALEKARLINYVVFDKTGTLTSGELTMDGVLPLAENHDQDSLLSLAAAAEKDSEHSIARSIVTAAEKRSLDIPEAGSFSALPGRGIRAETEKGEIYVGGPNLLEYLELKEPQDPAVKEAARSGHGLVYVVVNKKIAGLLTFSDTVRKESMETVEALRRDGIKVAILTGDSREAAEDTAGKLGITEIYAGILPENKAEIIKKLQSKGFTVAMVGDGVNDAPAIVHADVGVAIGAGTDVAVETAGIILVKNDPRDVVRLVRLSRSVYRKMVQNLVWATGYNLLAIPLAAGVLAPLGFVMPMAVGAIVMSASTIIVALNAQLLKRLDL